MKRSLGLVLFVAACSGPSGPLDQRVQVPADQPGYLKFLATELTIQPGEDKMYCIHMRYDGDDVAFDDVESLQGLGGHHAILLAAKEQMPDGTVEDCSGPGDMARYDAFTIPLELPKGYGSILRKGTSIVLQSHYVNASASPILVRDVVRLRTKPMSEVKTWAAMLATNTVDFEVPANETKRLSFDCEMPQDVELLAIGGHMHEWGTRFEAQVGPDAGSMKPVYLAEPWKPEFRDTPPITLLYNTPMKLAKGSILRTTCEWHNDTGAPLGFPNEMCATFGYVGGAMDPVVCRLGEE